MYSLYIKKKIKIQDAGMQGTIRQRKRSPQMIIMANCMFSLTHSSASKGSSGDFVDGIRVFNNPCFLW